MLPGKTVKQANISLGCYLMWLKDRRCEKAPRIGGHRRNISANAKIRGDALIEVSSCHEYE